MKVQRIFLLCCVFISFALVQGKWSKWIRLVSKISKCTNKCSDTYRPVCGSDNKTYTNMCYFRNKKCLDKKVFVKYKSACRQKVSDKKCKKKCPLIKRPVCGSDGRTYPNLCVFQNIQCRYKKLTLRYKTACFRKDRRCRRKCLRTYKPVCGSDGKTYRNMCFFVQRQCRFKKLSVMHKKACFRKGKNKRCRRKCPQTYKPVCGSDGRTYNNMCTFIKRQCRFKKLSLRSRKACFKKDKRCRRKCSQTYRPVCGSDRKTYPNMCTFFKRQCRFKKLFVVYRRACFKKGKLCRRKCRRIFQPVCASDGRTYRNMCSFLKRRCRYKMLTIKYTQACSRKGSDRKGRIKCGVKCPRTYKPVCGTDDKTYRNMCTFRKRQCRYKRLSIKYKSACYRKVGKCTRICPLKYKPVCGSDGRTYMNTCTFINRQCRFKSLFMRYRSACPRKVKVNKCTRLCPKRYRPVCGSDGRTYRNMCTFLAKRCRYRRLSLRYRRACLRRVYKNRRICPMTYRPVCGSDGRTYRNMCTFRASRLKTLSIRPRFRCFLRVVLGRNRRCRRRCPSIYRPVCGSDGRLYSNMCVFRAVLCRKWYRSLTLAHKSRCWKKARRCPRFCPMNYRPVCGSDGNTYTNMCTFRARQCRQRRLRRVYYGTCRGTRRTSLKFSLSFH